MKNFTFYSNSSWRFNSTIETSINSFQKKKRTKNTSIPRRTFKQLKYLTLIFFLAGLSPFQTAFGQSSWNTLLGDYAGRDLTGDQNTLIGWNVGSRASGDNNVMVGFLAAPGSSSGKENVFVGAYSGYDLTTGYGNAFLGMETGARNQSGFHNTYIGRSAGRDNLTGNSNVLVGGEAGLLSNGSNNTFLGHRAGYNNKGNLNIFIGKSAGYNESGSNKLYIDNTDTTTPLIYGDFAANTLTFNGNTNTTGNTTTTGALIFGSTTRQMINLWNTNYGIGIQSGT
ncbi:hypothetical protein E1171_00615, partial [Cytophagales bacterium RKSG123]|nr:hypothetical protein [Xanthovirga aplysinae]